MNVLLTGGTGFIGQASMRAMKKRGWHVRALVRSGDGAPATWLRRQGATRLAGDVPSDGPWMRGLGGVDLMRHNAGVYEIGADAPSQPQDETHRHDGDHLTPYARSEFDAHELALRWRARGLPLVAAMPNAMVGATTTRSSATCCGCNCSARWRGWPSAKTWCWPASMSMRWPTACAGPARARRPASTACSAATQDPAGEVCAPDRTHAPPRRAGPTLTAKVGASKVSSPHGRVPTPAARSRFRERPLSGPWRVGSPMSLRTAPCH